MSKLYEKLKRYGKSGAYSMHMPGHKGKLCAFDITEISDFDNLANPTGILKELEEDWAKVYGAKTAHISVNGSTGAILSAICGIIEKGDKIIMARNCHKSVYNAAELMEAKQSYIFPNYDEIGIAKGIKKETVEEAISQNPDAKLVIITSPTYEGVISETRGIIKACHKNNIPILIDMAHGAHLKFMGEEERIYKEADAIAISLHKTLPSLTQTALLLLNGKIIDKKRIKEKLNVFNTSSPSYILMSSVSTCLDDVQNEESFDTYKKNLDAFYKTTASLKNLEIKVQDDMGKIVISTAKTNISGKTLLKRLRDEFEIELEMAYDNYALAMTSVCDNKKAFKKLKKALFKIDKELKEEETKPVVYPTPKQNKKKPAGEKELVLISKAEGRICADYLWAYPPGVPIIAPNEVVDKETVAYLKTIKDTEIYGSNGSDGRRILVYK